MVDTQLSPEAVALMETVYDTLAGSTDPEDQHQRICAVLNGLCGYFSWMGTDREVTRKNLTLMLCTVLDATYEWCEDKVPEDKLKIN